MILIWFKKSHKCNADTVSHVLRWYPNMLLSVDFAFVSVSRVWIYKLKGFPLGSTMFSKAFTRIKSESEGKYEQIEKTKQFYILQ
jgi:membrane protein required for beta-lactamase induction